jgi:hypothetical protein
MTFGWQRHQLRFDVENRFIGTKAKVWREQVSRNRVPCFVHSD